MNKELINLQRNSNATCVVIENENYKEVSPCVSIKANVSDNFLLKETNKFMDKIISQSQRFDISYFIIKNFDEVSFECQERFIGLIKDRELENYTLPKNCIIILTVKNKDSLKKISPKIYHFSVVAI